MKVICRCFGKTLDLSVIRRTAELMLGVPDYDAYRAHMAARHPDLPALEREAFYRARQQARYGATSMRCC